MPYNGSGTFDVYTPGTPFITGTTISSTVANNVNSDFATGLSTAVTKDGQTTTTQIVPFAAGINVSGLLKFAGATGAANTKAFMNAAGSASEWSVGIKIIGFTRDLTAAGGDVAYTGAGFKPSHVIFFAGGPSSLVGGGSWGMDDGTNHKAIVAVAATPGAFASDTGHSISIFEAAGTAGQTALIKTLDSDGFTLTWAKTGSPSSGTNQIYALCLR